MTESWSDQISSAQPVTLLAAGQLQLLCSQSRGREGEQHSPVLSRANSPCVFHVVGCWLFAKLILDSSSSAVLFLLITGVEKHKLQLTQRDPLAASVGFDPESVGVVVLVAHD